MVCRPTLASFGIFLTTALYLRDDRGTLLRTAGLSNRVGSPPNSTRRASLVMGTSWLVRGCFRGDGILRGAGQSRHQAMRRNARVAIVWGAGPPRGHERTPDRAVRRPYWGAANLRDCGHARLVSVGRNETRELSLMSAVEVNSGTGICLKISKQQNHKIARKGPAADAAHPMTTTTRKSPAWGKRGFQCGLVRPWGSLRGMSCPAAKGSRSRRPDM